MPLHEALEMLFMDGRFSTEKASYGDIDFLRIWGAESGEELACLEIFGDNETSWRIVQAEPVLALVGPEQIR